MKKHNEQFEKNISRLVKTTGQSQIPSENFTNSLIDEALKEIQTGQPGRQKRSLVMKNTKRFITVAACFLVAACAIFFVAESFMGKTSKAKLVQNIYTQQVHEGKHSKLYDLGIFPAHGEAINGSDLIVLGCAPAESQMQMAHGGTTPPNGEPVDAMFFRNYGVNPFVDTEDDPLSTFAIDVDSGSYTMCRSYLQQGNLPPRDAVRVEEFVNYFDYGYPAPQNDTFAVFVEAMPWQFGAERKNAHLMRIGLKALEIPDEARKPAILTFVIDVSGSMAREGRLGLVKQSLELLVSKLRPQDKIGIAVYGSQGKEVLPHTDLTNKRRILRAIEALESEGSTNAEEGIRIGYAMAEEAFVTGYINRVILCSDGVANVGATGPDQIMQIIKDKADKGITLSALGFGMGNYNDVLMEQLGNKGNGYYAYIDTLEQAGRLFGNLTGALQVVARDVKVQVDFNPDVVRSYRLIGYENRDVADVDFRNDVVDGGEIGAGHSTTALYELKLRPDAAGDIATTYVRYKDADTFAVTEFSTTFETSQITGGFESVSDSFALASVVTEFAEILRESYWAKGASPADTLDRARRLSRFAEKDPDVKELIDLIDKAAGLISRQEIQQETLKPADLEYQTR